MSRCVNRLEDPFAVIIGVWESEGAERGFGLARPGS
jgi:hypothetical protein